MPKKSKIAYPNQPTFKDVNKVNINKWIAAAKSIITKEKNGSDRVSAIRQVTSGWQNPDVLSFLNWLKFYEEGAHMKYKKAQVWYENGAPGYFLHIKKDVQKSEDQILQEQNIQTEQENKKAIIESQRKKIIARLDSAEKLLRSQEGQIFAGKELEILMESIFALKKKIQLINKLSVATKLYEDIIIQKANILNKAGFTKAASMLHSIAQEIPAATSPDAPTTPSGNVSGTPSMGPGMPQTPPESAEQNPPLPEPPKKEETPTPKGLQDFLEKLETSNISSSEDMNDSDSFNSNDYSIEIEEDEDDALFVTAQELPETPEVQVEEETDKDKIKLPEDIEKPVKTPMVPAGPVENPQTTEPNDEDLEVKEEVSEENASSSGNPNHLDAKMNDLFKNVTIEDVIAKLENVSVVVKKRDIARELSFIDMALTKLNLATYCEELYESLGKSFDLYNYIGIRIDSVLSKLKGAVETTSIEITPVKLDSKLESIKNKLENDEQKEQERKDLRKNKEINDLEKSEESSKETPKVDIVEDMKETEAPSAQPKVQSNEITR
jgi:hypothetical protein